MPCWAHVRRNFYDLHAAGQSPLATEAVGRIAALDAIERDLRGRPPDQRARERQARAGPLLEAMHAWLTTTLARVPGRGDLAGAIRYALARWTALTRYLGDGTLEIDNNPVERAIRPLTLGRRNWLFAGSDAGASYCSSRHVLTKAGDSVGDYQAAGVVTAAHLLHYARMRMPSQLAG